MIPPDLDNLSNSDIIALEYAMKNLKNSYCKICYSEPYGRILSLEDILENIGEKEDYITYIKVQAEVKTQFLI